MVRLRRSEPEDRRLLVCASARRALGKPHAFLFSATILSIAAESQVVGLQGELVLATPGAYVWGWTGGPAVASHVRNFTAALTPSHELLFLHEVMADGVGASRAGESNATDVPFDMTGVPLTPLHVKALKDGQWEDRGQFPVPGRPVMVTVYNHDPRWPRRGSGDETGYVELDLRDADGDGLADVVLASGEVVGWDAAKASWVLKSDDDENATRVARLKSDDAQAELSLLAAMDAARSTAVAPRLGVARKAAKPLFEQDRPWEPHIDNGYPSVIYQRDAPRGTAQWLLFYDAYTTGQVGCSFARTAPFQNTPPACANEASLYAESGDGLSGWTKPSLGVCPWPPGAAATKTNTANNIFKCPWHDGTFENPVSVFRDTGPSAPRAAAGQPPVLTSFGMWGTKPTDSREDNCGWNGYVARSYDAGRTWVNRTRLLTEDPNCEGG